MIEPIRGQLGAYDVSCSTCGVVERFEDLRLQAHILKPRLAAKGFRMANGRPCCLDCEAPP
jgi:hypothetical protein